MERTYGGGNYSTTYSTTFGPKNRYGFKIVGRVVYVFHARVNRKEDDWNKMDEMMNNVGFVPKNGFLIVAVSTKTKREFQGKAYQMPIHVSRAQCEKKLHEVLAKYE